ncbi:hypothetical protein HPB52_017029 [Rhipicephalus sanguineus]|uniref:Uncharacterized protein n=1 Tax=Rhipicephalus sanguineus TaxID=34632 RepID=A0A9D4SR88_RHISA|nr:hypothetical protein HPB52_017029 [Rhipicephalus sanguineus]
MTSTVPANDSASMDASDSNEYPADPDDGSWFTATRRRKPKTHNEFCTRARACQKSGDPRPPPLPVDDLKVVFRPQGGLRLSDWAQHLVARAISIAAGLPGETVNKLLFRINAERNIAIASTPDETTATKLQAVTVINLGTQRYETHAYIAAPDNSCKGVIMGPEKNTSPTELLDNIYTPDAEILHARMMGSTNTALITFAGLQVPRYVYYYRAEYRCYIHRPRKQVCTICLALGHRADVCPTPSERRCHACGVETPAPQHSCTTRCFHCKGDHPATHPQCPARERKPPNKQYVKKALEAKALTQPPTSPPKGHRPRSRTRRSRSKSRGKSQDKSTTPLKNTPGTTSKPRAPTPGPIQKKNRSGSAEGSESPPAKKPAPAGQTPPAKVSWAAGPPRLNSPLPPSSPSPSLHTHPNVPPTSNVHNCTKQELQDALATLRDSLKAEVTSMIAEAINDFRAELRDMLKAHTQALVTELKQHIQESFASFSAGPQDSSPLAPNIKGLTKRPHPYIRPSLLTQDTVLKEQDGPPSTS